MDRLTIPREDREALLNFGFELAKEEPIGRVRATSTVYLGKCTKYAKRVLEDGSVIRLEGLPCVIKVTPLKRGAQAKYEEQRLERVEHQGIVDVYLNFKSSNQRYFVMEYMNGDTLSTRLKITEPDVPESEVVSIFQQLCSGLQYLHRNNIVHKDLNLDNIMITRDQENNLHYKIVDFGNPDESPEADETQKMIDMSMLATYFTIVMEKSQFQDNELKERLRLLLDDIQEKKFPTMGAVIEQLNMLQAGGDQPPAPSGPQVPGEDKEFLSAIGFDVLHFIGEGLNGVVFYGLCNENTRTGQSTLEGTPCAIKMFKKDRGTEDEIYEEMHAIKSVDHPNVVRVYEVCRTQNNSYIIMEFLEGDSLEDLLEKHERARTRMDEATALTIIRQVIIGLHYLHQNKFLHRDLHNGNIMLTRQNNNLVVKIVDLGKVMNIDKSHPKLDIRPLGYVINDIMEKTTFVREKVKSDLAKFSEMLNSMEQMTTMDEVINHMNQILPRSDAPSPIAKASSTFSRFFKR